MLETSGNPEEVGQFTVPLNDAGELRQQLMEFKELCDAHDSLTRKRGKHRYYHFGLMANLEIGTTRDELQRLLKNGTRTLMIDSVTNKQEEFQLILQQAREVIEEFQTQQELVTVPVDLALEITGDCCRLGRIHNNCSVLIKEGDVITLTTDIRYKHCSYKQIAYCINLQYYIKTFKVNDEVVIGKDARAKIVKVLKRSIALLALKPGIISSYDFVDLPVHSYSQKNIRFSEMYQADLDLALSIKANYVVLRRIRWKAFIMDLYKRVKPYKDLNLIGSIDLEYASNAMLDIMTFIKNVDYLWISEMYSSNQNIECFIFDNVVPLAKCYKKPIIGSIPLERCSDFKRFENHDFLWKIDAILIEKSVWCRKYPLIVKKLLPIVDYRSGPVDEVSFKQILNTYNSIVNFIIRTISSIECQAILIYTKCQSAALALGRMEIYCPVYALLPLTNTDDDQSKIRLARMFNLRRNLHSIMYTKKMNKCNLQPLEFGIYYMRKNCVINTGDFIITLEVGKEDEESIRLGMGDEVIILRAYYLPPEQVTNKFKFA